MNIRIRKGLKHNLNRILLLLIVFALFLYFRLFDEIYGNIMLQYAFNFYTELYLGFYLPVFLVSTLLIIKDTWRIEIVIRKKNKWDYILNLFTEIGKNAGIYAGTLTFGWFFMIGTGVDSWYDKENWTFISILFLTQLIGWMVTGMLELLLYMLFKRLSLAFTLCYFVFLSTNPRMHIIHNQQLVNYTEIYNMMFHYEKFESVFTFISVICFYIAIMLGSIWLCYWIIRHHDFLDGGELVHGTNTSSEK